MRFVCLLPLLFLGAAISADNPIDDELTIDANDPNLNIGQQSISHAVHASTQEHTTPSASDASSPLSSRRSSMSNIPADSEELPLGLRRTGRGLGPPEGLRVFIRQKHGISQIKQLIFDMLFEDEQKLQSFLGKLIPREIPPIALRFGTKLLLSNPRVLRLKRPKTEEIDFASDGITVSFQNCDFEVEFDAKVILGSWSPIKLAHIKIGSENLSLMAKIMPRIEPDDVNDPSSGHMVIDIIQLDLDITDRLDIEFSETLRGIDISATFIYRSIDYWFHWWLRPQISSWIQWFIKRKVPKITHSFVRSQTQAIFRVIDNLATEYEARSNMADNFEYTDAYIQVGDGYFMGQGHLKLHSLPVARVKPGDFERAFLNPLPKTWTVGEGNEVVDYRVDARFGLPFRDTTDRRTDQTPLIEPEQQAAAIATNAAAVPAEGERLGSSSEPVAIDEPVPVIPVTPTRMRPRRRTAPEVIEEAFARQRHEDMLARMRALAPTEALMEQPADQPTVEPDQPDVLEASTDNIGTNTETVVEQPSLSRDKLPKRLWTCVKGVCGYAGRRIRRNPFKRRPRIDFEIPDRVIPNIVPNAQPRPTDEEVDIVDAKDRHPSSTDEEDDFTDADEYPWGEDEIIYSIHEEPEFSPATLDDPSVTPVTPYVSDNGAIPQVPLPIDDEVVPEPLVPEPHPGIQDRAVFTGQSLNGRTRGSWECTKDACRYIGRKVSAMKKGKPSGSDERVIEREPAFGSPETNSHLPIAEIQSSTIGKNVLFDIAEEDEDTLKDSDFAEEQPLRGSRKRERLARSWQKFKARLGRRSRQAE